MISDFSNRLMKCFGSRLNTYQSNLLKIFSDEISKLSKELNRKFKLNITKFDVEAAENEPRSWYLDELVDTFAWHWKSYGTHYFRIHLSEIIRHYNLSNSRYNLMYKSIEDFVKDCACHELFHVYDEELNGMRDYDHLGWWIENYNPHYLDKNTNKEDYHRRYIDPKHNLDIIIDIEKDTDGKKYDIAYFSSKYSNAVIRFNRYPISKIKFDRKPKTNLNHKDKYNELIKLRMRSGGYLNYLYQRLPSNLDYDIVLVDLGVGIYRLDNIGPRSDINLLININIINKYLETDDVRYLDLIIYRLNNVGPDNYIKLFSELYDS